MRGEKGGKKKKGKSKHKKNEKKDVKNEEKYEKRNKGKKKRIGKGKMNNQVMGPIKKKRWKWLIIDGDFEWMY